MQLEGPEDEIRSREEYQIGREWQDRAQGGPSAYFSKVDLVPALERKEGCLPFPPVSCCPQFPGPVTQTDCL